MEKLSRASTVDAAVFRSHRHRHCEMQLQSVEAQFYRGLTERKRENSRVERIVGITGPRGRCKADYKGVKSIKITMYFSSRCCVHGIVLGNETGRRGGDER